MPPEFLVGKQVKVFLGGRAGELRLCNVLGYEPTSTYHTLHRYALDETKLEGVEERYLLEEIVWLEGVPVLVRSPPPVKAGSQDSTFDVESPGERTWLAGLV